MFPVLVEVSLLRSVCLLLWFQGAIEDIEGILGTTVQNAEDLEAQESEDQ